MCTELSYLSFDYILLKICDSRDQATTDYNEESKRKQDSIPSGSVIVPSADVIVVGPTVTGTKNITKYIFHIYNV